MKNNLRKVTFYTDRPQGFMPEDENHIKNKQEDVNDGKKTGYFHCWVSEERKSPQSGLFREETVALVEEELTGKLFHVEYDLLRFVNN